jgi:hypothetical protein
MLAIIRRCDSIGITINMCFEVKNSDGCAEDISWQDIGQSFFRDVLDEPYTRLV